MSDSDTVPPSDAAQSNDTRIIDAPFPFNRATADLILRSSDRVDFRVRRGIPAEASNFFEDMFQLPQPAVGRSLEETRDALPIVDMEEDSSTLERLLRLCYPAAGNTPKIENLDDLRRVIRAAIKYAMPQLLDTLKGDLRSFADAYPVRVYAIALVLKLEDEARAAAKAFLAFSILESADAPELAEITGKQFNNLLKYHRACSAKATPVANQPPWALKRNGNTWFDSHHSGCQRDYVGDYYASSWWKRYMTRSAALLETTPSGKALLVDSRIDAALKEAVVDCTTCGRSAPGQMRCFVREFAQKVDEAVAEVPLVIE
ncbi:uncharacterized protein C8Q71DRAFT_861024 [Rhodofomes roseus]|uniref:BTB domain-containing protein n=1 Tax=Rhodofomes roseus TaxID=34475 RepID=A0ABQ8K6G2_9APHY|nr:uncharacterized protein C8Q71DRAFT_861024 [Rhodofomes roseus]KAH9832642.1 hypothetical protein C8Q71DRAFT_861024 [Rhodofomes roseus]